MNCGTPHFKIFFPKNKYFYVFICKDRKSMYNLRKTISTQYKLGYYKEDYEAITLHWANPGKDNCLGFILFNRPHLTIEDISHETFHAALCWAEAVKIKKSRIWKTNTQERIAYPFGRAVSRIIKMWFNLLKKDKK